MNKLNKNNFLLFRRIRLVDPEKAGVYRYIVTFSMVMTSTYYLSNQIFLILIITFSQEEFIAIVAGLDQNTSDSLIEEHVKQIKEDIVNT